MRVISVINLKGGTAKTTTAVFLAHALVEQGHNVIVVDADPQGSALEWSSMADFSLPVVGMPTTTLHRQLFGVVDADRYDVVLIDTPPLEEEAGIVNSALRASTDVVIPLAPTMMEFNRLKKVWPTIDDVAPLHDEPLAVSVLLNRVVANASSTGVFRDALAEQNRQVLDTFTPRLERYAQAFSFPVPEGDEPHHAAAKEIMSRGAQ